MLPQLRKVCVGLSTLRERDKDLDLVVLLRWLIEWQQQRQEQETHPAVPLDCRCALSAGVCVTLAIAGSWVRLWGSSPSQRRPLWSGPSALLCTVSVTRRDVASWLNPPQLSTRALHLACPSKQASLLACLLLLLCAWLTEEEQCHSLPPKELVCWGVLFLRWENWLELEISCYHLLSFVDHKVHSSNFVLKFWIDNFFVKSIEKRTVKVVVKSL